MKIAREISYAALAAGLLALPQAGHAQASASPFTQATRYDAAGRVTGTIAPDPDGGGSLHYAAVRNTYDSAGRLTKVETGELANWQPESVAPSAWSGFTILKTQNTTYDAMSRKTRDSLVGSDGVTANVTDYSYDPFGRPECTTVRMNKAVFGSLPANACTLSTQSSAGPDRITRNQYDAAGQLTVVQKAYGVPGLQQDYATYSYTNNGKRKSMKDANGNLATMEYDGFDRQNRWNFPSVTTPGQVNLDDNETYGYDANGSRTSLKKRDGQTIAYTYDALDRMTLKHPSTGSDTYYGYDLRGLQLYARFGSSSGQGVTDSWDNAGRKSSSSINMSGVTRTLAYQYDADGNRIRLTYPDGTSYVQFDYDGLDRMTALRPNGGAAGATIAYDNAGRRSGITRPNGVPTVYGYDGVGRLQSLSHDLFGTAYDYAASWTYNSADQVATRAVDTDLYAWAAANASTTYVPNGLNQYSQVSGTTYDYDLNGNLTSDGSSTFSYDIENRLTGATGAKNAVITYDPLGRIFQTGGGAAGTTTFLYDGDALVARYDSAGTMLRRYAHGPGVDEPLLWYEGADFSVPRYFHADNQGSIAAVSTSSGNKYVINTYDDYGTPGSGNVGQFQYTGQVFIPEAGLFNYKARFYSPVLGRFMQTDPVGYQDQVNLYAYVWNDPLNKTDPKGLDSGQMAYDSSLMLAEAMKDNPPDPASARVMIAGTIGAISCVFGCELAIPAAKRMFNELTGKTGTSAAQQASNAERASLTRSERSLERNVAEHKQKIEDYRRNPDAMDNQGRLANARTPAERQQIIQGRERALQQQLKKNENELAKVRQRLKELE